MIMLLMDACQFLDHVKQFITENFQGSKYIIIHIWKVKTFLHRITTFKSNLWIGYKMHVQYKEPLWVFINVTHIARLTRNPHWHHRILDFFKCG